MKRIYFLLCVLFLISCQDKVICPAFQSTYILNDSTRNAYFSYVWQLDEGTRSQFLSQQNNSDSEYDSAVTAPSQPKTDYYAYVGENNVPWRVPARTKYGVIKPVFKPIKKYRMRTAPMENLLGPDPASASDNYVVGIPADSLGTDSLNLASTDTLKVDPLAVNEDKKKERRFLYGYDPSDNFNVEQLYYNKYFSSRLIDNRPEPEPRPATTDTTSSDSTQAKKPFLKGIFRKKNRDQPADSVTTISDPIIESTEEEEGDE